MVAWSYPSNPVPDLQKCRRDGWMELAGQLLVREHFKVKLAVDLVEQNSLCGEDGAKIQSSGPFEAVRLLI